MGQIIKVYNTKANALIGGGTGMIASATINSNGGAIQNQTAAIPYYIYNEYFYRIESNEPVKEFHIDWDDGEDNSIENRNLEIIKLDIPSSFAVTSHIYTEARRFFPLIRVKSIDGFLSKFYTNDSSDNDFSGFAPVQKDSSNSNTVTYTNGENSYSQISLEKTSPSSGSGDLIPHFIPSNLPPIGILKSDRKVIFTGIDNKPIDALTTTNYPLLYGYSTSTTLGSSALVKLTIQTRIQDKNGVDSTLNNTGAVREYTLLGSDIVDEDADLEDISGSSSEMATKAVPFGNFDNSSNSTETTIFEFQTGAGGVADIDKNDLIGDYIIIYNNSLQYLIWFNVSGSDSQPTAATPIGGGVFQDTAEVDISGNISGTGTAIDGNDDIATQMNTVLRARNSSGQIGADFTITNPVNANVQFVTTSSGNQPDGVVSDMTHIVPQAAGEAAENFGQYVTVQGVDRYTRTDCVNKLLKAELLNVGKLSDTERIYIKVFSAVISDFSGNADVSEDDTVCILSNGNPIVEFNDPHTNVTFDASESFTKASNLSVSNYYFDKDDLKTATIQSQSPVMNTSDYLQFTATTSPSYTESYTHHNKGHLKDSDSRFLDFYRLNRVQVADNYTIVTGQDDISNRRSFVEHFDDDQYGSVNSTPAGASRIPTSEETRGYIALSNDDVIKTANWNKLDALYNTNGTIMGGSSTYALNGNTDATDHTLHPKNFLFLCKTDIFDRVYIRTNNAYSVDIKSASDSTAVDTDITAYYPTSNGWKPLEIVDNTQRLQTSGNIKFKLPSDWNKIKASDVESGSWSGPVDETTTGTAKSGHDPGSMWDFDAYAIIIAVDAKAVASNINVTNVWPYSNSHSQLTKIVDAHHISLNDIAIAQSISYSRNGKFQVMSDRMGKSEIRKIGVAGGTVRFGSVDLGDTDAQGNRKKIKRLQQDSVPVFLDITHQSGEKTRFFGIITDMSEDFPTGKQFPKYAVTMQVAYVIELDSSSNLLSGKISIGGNLDDSSKYISSA